MEIFFLISDYYTSIKVQLSASYKEFFPLFFYSMPSFQETPKKQKKQVSHGLSNLMLIFTNLSLVVAQGQKYRTPRKNQTHKQWFAPLACRTLHHEIPGQLYSISYNHDSVSTVGKWVRRDPSAENRKQRFNYYAPLHTCQLQTPIFGSSYHRRWQVGPFLQC